MHEEIVLHRDRESGRPSGQPITTRRDPRKNVQTFLAGLGSTRSVGINIG